MSGDPIASVEEIAGSVQEWPTYILLHLIVEHPSKRVLKQVSAFLYGNNVPLYKAIKLYIACRGQQYGDKIRKVVTRWYRTWNAYPCDIHFAEYYNTSVKRVLWLN